MPFTHSPLLGQSSSATRLAEKKKPSRLVPFFRTGADDANMEISSGGSAAAAGDLVKKLGGDLIGYLFILQIPELDGSSKLGGVQTVTLLDN